MTQSRNCVHLMHYIYNKCIKDILFKFPSIDNINISKTAMFCVHATDYISHMRHTYTLLIKVLFTNAKTNAR